MHQTNENSHHTEATYAFSLRNRAVRRRSAVCGHSSSAADPTVCCSPTGIVRTVGVKPTVLIVLCCFLYVLSPPRHADLSAGATYRHDHFSFPRLFAVSAAAAANTISPDEHLYLAATFPSDGAPYQHSRNNGDDEAAAARRDARCPANFDRSQCPSYAFSERLFDFSRRVDPTACTNLQECGRCFVGDEWAARLASLGLGTTTRERAAVAPWVLALNWLSHEYMTTIAMILLREAMGYERVRAAPSANQGNVDFICCGAEEFMVDFERWGNGEFLTEEGFFTVATVPLGYTGTSSLFVPAYTLERYPMADAFNAYKYLPEYANIFPRAFSTNCSDMLLDKSPANVAACGQAGATHRYVCDDNPWTDTACEAGHYVPPQCRGEANRSHCQELYMTDPYYDTAIFEAIVKNNKLNFTGAYIGAADYPTFIKKKHAEGRDFVFYWYSPDPLAAAVGARAINFDPTTPECLRVRTADPTTSGGACAYPVTTLQKFARRDVLRRDADFRFFFDSFTISEGAINKLLAGHSSGAGNQTVFEGSCAWLKDNYATWAPWVRHTPLGYEGGGSLGVGDGAFQAWIIAIPVVLVLLIAVAAVASVCLRRRLSNRHAPKTAPLALLFTDVERSTTLWELCGTDMKAAMRTHNEVIRKLIADYEAYEVKTNGDSFMIACKSLTDATMLALAIQTGLNEASYPASITETYELLHAGDVSRNPSPADDNDEDDDGEGGGEGSSGQDNKKYTSMNIVSPNDGDGLAPYPYFSSPRKDARRRNSTNNNNVKNKKRTGGGNGPAAVRSPPSEGNIAAGGVSFNRMSESGAASSVVLASSFQQQQLQPQPTSFVGSFAALVGGPPLRPTFVVGTAGKADHPFAVRGGESGGGESPRQPEEVHVNEAAASAGGGGGGGGSATVAVAVGSASTCLAGDVSRFPSAGALALRGVALTRSDGPLHSGVGGGGGDSSSGAAVLGEELTSFALRDDGASYSAGAAPAEDSGGEEEVAAGAHATFTPPNGCSAPSLPSVIPLPQQRQHKHEAFGGVNNTTNLNSGSTNAQLLGATMMTTTTTSATTVSSQQPQAAHQPTAHHHTNHHNQQGPASSLIGGASSMVWESASRFRAAHPPPLGASLRAQHQQLTVVTVPSSSFASNSGYAGGGGPSAKYLQSHSTSTAAKRNINNGGEADSAGIIGTTTTVAVLNATGSSSQAFESTNNNNDNNTWKDKDTASLGLLGVGAPLDNDNEGSGSGGGGSVSNSEQHRPWNGLRVRIALHWCSEVAPQLDPKTGRYDYFGHDVNVCARVEGYARGGEITVHEDTYLALSRSEEYTDLVAPDVTARQVAKAAELKGVNAKVALWSLLPLGLRGRLFPSLAGVELPDGERGGGGATIDGDFSGTNNGGGGGDVSVWASSSDKGSNSAAAAPPSLTDTAAGGGILSSYYRDGDSHSQRQRQRGGGGGPMWGAPSAPLSRSASLYSVGSRVSTIRASMLDGKAGGNHNSNSNVAFETNNTMGLHNNTNANDGINSNGSRVSVTPSNAAANANTPAALHQLLSREVGQAIRHTVAAGTAVLPADAERITWLLALGARAGALRPEAMAASRRSVGRLTRVVQSAVASEYINAQIAVARAQQLRQTAAAAASARRRAEQQRRQQQQLQQQQRQSGDDEKASAAQQFLAEAGIGIGPSAEGATSSSAAR